MFILVYLKKLLQGSKLDRYLRLIVSYLSPFYYRYSRKPIFNDESKFIYICYGGLGDCILAFPFLKRISQNYKLTIFIENKFKDVDVLLSDNIEIIFYVKKNILKELKKYRKINKNYILIQQSPILEFILFHIFLKRPPTIGFVYKQNQIAFEGFPIEKKEIKTDNKYLKYSILEKTIINIASKNMSKQINPIYTSKYQNLKFTYVLDFRYFILSPTKDANWSMGFLDYKIYTNFIQKMIENTQLKPVIVGTREDKKIIDNILINLPSRLKPLNLAGKTGIIDLIGLIKQSDFVVANDNGVHHLSNFLNKQTLTLYNFSSYKVYNWPNINSNYIFKPLYNCMPCVGKENGPFDNYPFKCPWNIRCKYTIDEEDIFKKLGELKWI